MKTIAFALLFLAQIGLAQQSPGLHPGRAWTLSTDKVQRVIALEDGRLFTRSWTDRSNGRELLRGVKADELVVVGLDVGCTFIAHTLRGAIPRCTSNASAGTHLVALLSPNISLLAL
jgi:hypothetical protein